MRRPSDLDPAKGIAACVGIGAVLWALAICVGLAVFHYGLPL